jgi:hypothetical protein
MPMEGVACRGLRLFWNHQAESNFLPPWTPESGSLSRKELGLQDAEIPFTELTMPDLHVLQKRKVGSAKKTGPQL